MRHYIAPLHGMPVIRRHVMPLSHANGSYRQVAGHQRAITAFEEGHR